MTPNTAKKGLLQARVLTQTATMLTANKLRFSPFLQKMQLTKFMKNVVGFSKNFFLYKLEFYLTKRKYSQKKLMKHYSIKLNEMRLSRRD
mmetsp:Transcript_6068/g.5684  ORF Transcript_6068/g.5684 Transcript_6068/m.5684 type:complete len:90 (-) Transcript_6068:360-629(-)